MCHVLNSSVYLANLATTRAESIAARPAQPRCADRLAFNLIATVVFLLVPKPNECLAPILVSFKGVWVWFSSYPVAIRTFISGCHCSLLLACHSVYESGLATLAATRAEFNHPCRTVAQPQGADRLGFGNYSSLESINHAVLIFGKVVSHGKASNLKYTRSCFDLNFISLE